MKRNPEEDVWLDPYQFTQSGRGIKMVNPTHGLKDLAYQDIKVYQSRKQCILCRVIGDLLHQYALKTKATSNLKFGPWRPFAMRRADPSCKDSSGSSDATTEICLLPGAILTVERGISTHKPIVLKFTLQYATPRFNLVQVTPWIPPPTLSLPNLAKWLTNCRANHTKQCNSFAAPMSLPPGLRLIDTTTNSITLCTTPVPYIALSYCWAGAATSPAQNLQLVLSNVTRLSQPNSLNPTNLPPVIADAIHLCRSLGHRHLWVDQLCIIQDDPVSKLDQINAMDSIYHTALFTIVDLSTVPGLPGTSRPRDVVPHGLWDGTLDAVFGEANAPVAGWAIDKSVWNTRGWTFQERKLSRRMVFVDGERAWLSCYRGSFWEFDARAWETVGEEEEVPNEEGEVGVYLTENFRSYATLVGPYSERKLSFRSDRLNAFMGVGSVLGKRLETGLVGGLPERWLMQGLLWRGLCKGGWEEKLGFPSWSWAGWDGRVDYGMGEGNGEGVRRGAMDAFWSWYGPEVGSLVTFWYSDGKVVRRLEEGRWWFTSQDMWDEEYEAHQYDLRDRLEERPDDVHAAMVANSWERCCHNPWEMMGHMDITPEARAKGETMPGSLVFTTTCILLNLRLNDDGGSGPVCFDVVDENVGFVGQTMMMDREWAKTFDVGRKYGIVVVGAGEAKVKEREHPVWCDPATGRAFQLALYVLVTDHKDGVLYRRAVGVVDLFAWTRLGPSWRSVVLG
ncbi:hypothetical protein OQA88_10900 [Cercophora sp. LCS_1]